MDQAVSNKKILITGGTGYIGSYLGKYLSLNGLDVTLGTRNIPNNPPDKKLKYLISEIILDKLKSNFRERFMYVANSNLNMRRIVEDPTQLKLFD